jgi:hypothetical protein
MRKRLDRISQVAAVPLKLTADESNRLAEALTKASSEKPESDRRWLKATKHFAISVEHELDARIVRVHADSIEIPDIPPLPFAPGYRVTGFTSTMDQVVLHFGPDGWAVEIRRSPPRKKPTKAKKRKQAQKPMKAKKRKRERLYSHAAIFVTDKTGYRVWSGGLPSLGKRK